MLLQVRERLLLVNALPPTGDFTTMRTMRQLREKLALTDEEQGALAFKVNPENGTATWDGTKDEGAEIDLTPSQIGAVVAVMTRLNDEKKLTEQHISLYEKVFPEKARE